MASTRTRQRKLERDRYERKMVRRAQQQRRKRQVQAGIGAFLALALLGTGTAWLMGRFDPAPEEPPQADRCVWTPVEGPERVDVGTPPVLPPTEGQRVVTVDLDAGGAGSGQVTIEVSVDQEPCGTANLEHLAAAGFYDGTVCHELTGEGALRCGDPGGTGEGGPGYAFYGENYPFGEFDPGVTPEPTPAADEEPEVFYPAGTVAFADVTGAQGSHLLFFYQDFAPEGPVWPILGTVTSGLDLLEAIGAAGVDGEEPPGPPAEEVRITSVTVSDPQTGSESANES